MYDIVAYFNKCDKFTTTEAQWRYNSGQKLQFKGVDLPDTYEVHFSNSITGTSVRQIGDSTGVLIPSSVFTPGSKIYAWIYVTQDGVSVTRYQVTIPIRPRAEIATVDPTPEELDIIEQAIQSLNTASEAIKSVSDDIQQKLDDALQEAKDSGAFDGKDGVSPTIQVTEIPGGHRLNIKDVSGEDTVDILDGKSDPQSAKIVTALMVSADMIDENPNTFLMPDGSVVHTLNAIGASDAYACKTGQTLTYKLSTQAERLIFAVYDAVGNLTHSVAGNGYSAYIEGSYTFTDNDAYFRVSGVIGGNYRKNYSLAYSYSLPNVVTRADLKPLEDSIDEAEADRTEIRSEVTQAFDTLNASGISWNNLPTEFYSGDSYTNNGITFTRSANGTVHSEGTATDQARYYWMYRYSMTPGTYTLGGVSDGAGMQSFALQYAITTGAPGSGDYRLILADTEITVPQGHFLSIRSWYKKGYVDEGHDWSVFLGKGIGETDSKYSPRNFVPIIYENKEILQGLKKQELPEYWKTYLQSKVSDIKAAVYEVGNHGVVFQFFTDFHLPQSDVNYRGYTTLPQILDYIKKNCFVEDVIFGGDILQKNDTVEEAVTVLEKYEQDFVDVKPLNVLGNHDSNPYGGDPAGSVLVNTDTLYSILFRRMESCVELKPGMYWYQDNEVQKVRIIALNTGVGILSEWNADTIQHKWLVDTLTRTPEGYTLIVIPHVFFQLSGGTLALSGIGNSIKSIIDAYASRGVGTWQGVSYDFTYAGGTVACIMCGHTHNDGMIMSDAGYPMIGTVCEAMWGSQQTVVRGTQAKETIDEHAFDIVCLNTDTRTIKYIRVGSGSDRTYTYISDRTSPMPEETVEVTVPDSGNVFVTIEAGKIYHFVGDLISLELELGPLSGGSRQYHFDFISGDTPPTLTFTEGLIPTAVIMPDGFEIEANRRYEVDIMNGYGVVQEWTT